VLSLPILQQLDWRKRDVFVAGPPGVYSPDVAGLYMSEQHMMRPPGKISRDYIAFNDLLAFSCTVAWPSVPACIIEATPEAVTLCKKKLLHGSCLVFFFMGLLI